MQTHLLKFACILALTGSAYGQHAIDPTNCREGENVEYCTQHKKSASMAEKNPAWYSGMIQAKEELNNMIRAKESNPSTKSTDTLFTIPVVFHILHNNGVENISDDQCFDALAILNRDYQLLNADAANVRDPFNPAVTPSTAVFPADLQIEFVMATKAPDGTCFNGITRTVSTLTNDGSDGYSQMTTIRNNNDVYNGLWNPQKYLNIYVCAEIGGAAGYTFNPSTWSTTDMYFNGIFVLHNYTGSIGTSSAYSSRTLTHEVGHWLNLDHVWGPNNNPGNPASCSEDDAVKDTPVCIGSTSCNLTANTCDDTSFPPSVTSWTTDVIDNVENYMDYSYCSRMFTPGQRTRMHTALGQTSTGRYYIWQPSNIQEVGGGEYAEFCEANFSANKTSVCAGDQIQFTDESFNNVVGWTWSFPGGSPSSSTEENPIVTYSTPGVYEVVLTATNGGTSLTETKSAYIQVNNPSGIPFIEGFESYTTFDGISEWTVVNPGNNAAWALTTSAGHTGTKSAKLQNYGQTGDNHDELIAAGVDLSSIADAATFSFRYAYRKRNTGDNERLEAHFSYDCGDQWQQRKTIVGSGLSPLTSSTSWTPSSIDDWTTVHVNITSIYWVSNFRYKFEFEGSGGNNVYLDNINIYAGGPSDELVDPASGLGELESVNDLKLYPNPTQNELNLGFKVDNNEDILINIMDLSGKVVYTQFVKAVAGSNLVMMDTNPLAKGIYMINVKTLQGSTSMRFVKQ